MKYKNEDPLGLTLPVGLILLCLSILMLMLSGEGCSSASDGPVTTTIAGSDPEPSAEDPVLNLFATAGTGAETPVVRFDAGALDAAPAHFDATTGPQDATAGWDATVPDAEVDAALMFGDSCTTSSQCPSCEDRNKAIVGCCIGDTCSCVACCLFGETCDCWQPDFPGSVEETCE